VSEKIIELPDCLSQASFDAWDEHRNEGPWSKIWGEAAKKAFVRKCAKLHQSGYSVDDIIDHGIDAGWRSVWPMKEFKREKRARETTVTDLTLVVTDRAKGAASIAEMKQRARQA